MTNIDIEFIPEEEEDDEKYYEPQPIAVFENSALIYDPAVFGELTNSIAAVMYEGNLLVMDRDTFELHNPAKPKPKPRPKLSGVKDE